MKTYFLKDRAANIRTQANRLEGLINRILILVDETKIDVNNLEKALLTKGIVNSIGSKAVLAQSATQAIFENANRSGRDTTKIEEDARKIGYLLEALKALENQKQMPDIWENTKINTQKLDMLIEKECTIELTDTQKSDIDLIEQVAEASGRFNPMAFVENGEALIEDYISFTNI
jgi:hypothetical protein